VRVLLPRAYHDGHQEDVDLMLAWTRTVLLARLRLKHGRPESLTEVLR